MSSKSLPQYLWKVALCGLLFFIGFMPGVQLATMKKVCTNHLCLLNQANLDMQNNFKENEPCIQESFSF
jgi:hypothetical protein